MDEEKVKENLIGLRTVLGLLVGELSFYREMIRLSAERDVKLGGKARQQAIEVKHHVETALKLLEDLREDLSKITEGVKKNSSSTQDSSSRLHT